MSSRQMKTLGAHTIHPSAAFEGVFAKFALPSGGTLILIPCTVRKASDPSRRHLLSVVYVPPSSTVSSAPATPWVCELRPSQIAAQITDKYTGAFTLVYLNDAGHEIASFTSTPAQNTYRIQIASPAIDFNATTSKRTPWSSTNSFLSPSSPEGILSYLPLPLHWHVHSLSSPAKFSLSLPNNAAQDQRDAEGSATVHEEKNWANGFPSAHVWCQARSPTSPSALRLAPNSDKLAPSPKSSLKARDESGICLAGGLTLGLLAFLVGYRHSSPELGQLEIDIRPPFAVGIPCDGGCLSPFLDFKVDWKARRWSVDVAGWTWRVVVEASGPGAGAEEVAEEEDAWFHFSSPKRDGFVENGMAETVAGSVRVRLLRRRWAWLGWSGWMPKLWEWEEVCEEVFEGAGMEFGGAFYGSLTFR